jgi:hypothetical protein
MQKQREKFKDSLCFSQESYRYDQTGGFAICVVCLHIVGYGLAKIRLKESDISCKEHKNMLLFRVRGSDGKMKRKQRATRCTVDQATVETVSHWHDLTKTYQFESKGDRFLCKMV